MPSDTPEADGVALIGLGLGSNIGDRPANIETALALLEARGIVTLTAVSSIYRTPPWGYLAQDDFANACALAETVLTPAKLLAAVKAIEADMGRQESLRWGPRLIDIDLLFYDGVPLATENLILPHKELFNRAFVLVPLAEIASDLTLDGRRIGEAAAGFADAKIVKWA